MIETKRLYIKPLTSEELKKHINSPNDLYISFISKPDKHIPVE